MATLLVLLRAALPCLVTVSGLYFLLRLRGFFFLHPLRSLGYLLRGDRLGPSLSALALALSGTLGVGSISGVALALAVGGPGAILWMWISAIFAMAVHYAEVTLALDGKGAGGRLHAALLLLLAPTLGGALQSAAAAETVSLVLGAPRLSVGLLLALGVGAVALLGLGKIARATERILPILSLLYLILTLGVILENAAALPAVLLSIVREGLSPSAAAGGILGCAWVGFSRGLLSNEAGCGTAVYAHAEARDADPCRQGLFGVLEVGIDTLLFCTLSALALLVSGEKIAGDLAPLLSGCRAVFGPLAPPLLALVLLFFAYAAALALLHHGSAARLSLGLGGERLYVLLFLLATALGSAIPIAGVAAFADLLLLAMTLLTVPRTVKAANRVVALSAARGLIRFGRKRESSTGALLPRHRDGRACQAPRARSSDR
jgi:AGCS family alanine or glycine:cation symporter